MRIAALYDIHGNLPALEAVIDAVRQRGVDLIVVGGDVLPGPMPAESLALLRSLEMPVAFLRGNGEREVLALRAGAIPTAVPPRFHPMMRWVADQLTEDTARWIDAWPTVVPLQLPVLGRVLFCHASPRSDAELFTSASPAPLVERILADTAAEVLVCGHTHLPYERRVGGTLVVNAGSVGMATGSGDAEWLLIDGAIAPQRTPYDREQAAARIRRSASPLADEFAATSVLSPPDPTIVLDALTEAADRAFTSHAG